MLFIYITTTTLLFSIVHKRILVNGNTVEDCEINKKIGCRERVAFTIKYADSSKDAYLRIQFTAFARIFHLILIRKQLELVKVLMPDQPNHEVTVDDTYDGYLANTPSSYFYGTYSNGSVNGDLDDGDVTYHLSTDEEADDGSLTVLVDNVNHATYAYKSQGRDGETPRKRHGKRRKRSSKYQNPYLLCTLNVVILKEYFAKKCTDSIDKCVTRILWYVHFVDRYFRRVDFNFDGNV